MPQKNKNKNSSTRLTTGGFANMIVLIIFLLTMGGAVVYFKNFPPEKLPAEQSIEQPQAVEMQKQATDKDTSTVAEVARRKGRDSQRVNDIKIFQTILESYFDSCGGYPRVSTLTIVGSSQFNPSFDIGCPKGISMRDYLGDYLMKDFPVNPKPGGQDYRYCSETAPGSGKCGIPTSGKAESYRLTFSLEGESWTLASGVHVATPKGIQ